MTRGAKKGALRSTPTLDEHLCFAVYAASHLFNRIYRERLESLGITYPQYLALLALAEGGKAVGELGRRLYLDSGTLTPLLKRLEKQGLVTRRRETDDERRVRVELTAKGRKLHAESKCVPETLFEAELDRRLPSYAELREGLRELVAVLDERVAA